MTRAGRYPGWLSIRSPSDAAGFTPKSLGPISSDALNGHCGVEPLACLLSTPPSHIWCGRPILLAVRGAVSPAVTRDGGLTPWLSRVSPAYCGPITWPTTPLSWSSCRRWLASCRPDPAFRPLRASGPHNRSAGCVPLAGAAVSPAVTPILRYCSVGHAIPGQATRAQSPPSLGSPVLAWRSHFTAERPAGVEPAHR